MLGNKLVRLFVATYAVVLHVLIFSLVYYSALSTV